MIEELLCEVEILTISVDDVIAVAMLEYVMKLLTISADEVMIGELLK